MNILEALYAYKQGKRIRHVSWDKGDYFSVKDNLVGSGISLLNIKSLFDLIEKYDSGWEIYIKREDVFKMRFGQKFIGPFGTQFMKINSTFGNSLNLTTYELHNFANAYELIDD